jgi:hypothetical protein
MQLCRNNALLLLLLLLPLLLCAGAAVRTCRLVVHCNIHEHMWP